MPVNRVEIEGTARRWRRSVGGSRQWWIEFMLCAQRPYAKEGWQDMFRVVQMAGDITASDPQPIVDGSTVRVIGRLQTFVPRKIEKYDRPSPAVEIVAESVVPC